MNNSSMPAFLRVEREQREARKRRDYANQAPPDARPVEVDADRASLRRARTKARLAMENAQEALKILNDLLADVQPRE